MYNILLIYTQKNIARKFSHLSTNFSHRNFCFSSVFSYNKDNIYYLFCMSFFKKYLLPILGIGIVLCVASIAFIEANYDYEYANMLAHRGIITDNAYRPEQYRL